jgi:glycosyltransferase involved in cell wall biosynthesis
VKIILVNKFLYPKGGAEVSTLVTGALLSGKGHEVHYWGMAHPSNPEYPYNDYFVSQVDYNKASGILTKFKAASNILYSFEAKKKIEEFIKEIKPDIVHLNNFYHQISPSILHVLKKHNIPTVMTMRDYKLVCPSYSMLADGKPCERCKGGRYYNCFFNKCTKNSYAKSFLNVVEMYLHHKILHIYDSIDVYISPSMFLKNKLEEMGFTHEIVHLPNFVDLGEYSPQYNWQQRSIVYFGRLSPEKGLSTLLEAVKGLNVQLKVIGDGPIRQELEKKAVVERINNVLFVGYKSGKELQKEIQNAMAAVTPSQWYENNPRTVIESFALGKPVIGARIGGIPELVKDGKTGYIFESGSVNELRSKINLLIEDPDKAIKMGRAARKYVEKELCSERHYGQLMEIYEMARENKSV